ncbi:hypothetical protein, partial [Pseudomonas sp. SID14000]|uniref:hypothetical protein n=1 Tax=Pseudomonas sp. SID14000 TaxID=1986221 RepID=UPI001C455AB3
DGATVTAGKGAFQQSTVNRRQEVTIVAGIKAGVVSNDKPIVVDPPSLLDRAGVTAPGLAGAGAVSVGAIGAAIAYSKRGNKDQRFSGMPPGAFPPGGMVAVPIKDELKESQLPVACWPPRIPVAEGGL